MTTHTKIWDRSAVRALFLPLGWMIILCLELAFFVDSKPTNLFLRIFEDIVFITSFLFYNSQGLLGYLERPVAQVFTSFALQFMFWWGVSYFFIYLKKRLSNREVSKS